MRGHAFFHRLKTWLTPEVSAARPSLTDTNHISAPDLIDVHEVLSRISVDELNQRAEEYFSRLPSGEHLLAKPFASIEEAPQLLMTFGQVLAGLNLAPGMTIVDFGAGSCWTSRSLSQLGMKVIAVDVSVSALRIGEELYRRNPLFGERVAPRFLVFDGRTIDLPDASVDRILCFDAFHHLPNPERVLAEMARILIPSGVAGFSEPGPDHSKQSQSQDEMRTHGVLENDIDINAIWDAARAAGFDGLHLAMFNAAPVYAGLEEFQDLVSGSQKRSEATTRLRNTELDYFSTHRLFFLHKAGEMRVDSRRKQGLAAKLSLSANQRIVAAGGVIDVIGTVTNTGSAQWLQPADGIGAVYLGVHLLDGTGKPVNLDHQRHALTAPTSARIESGDEIPVEARINVPQSPGSYILEFDLVSEGIAWFGESGTKPVRIAIEVLLDPRDRSK